MFVLIIWRLSGTTELQIWREYSCWLDNLAYILVDNFTSRLLFRIRRSCSYANAVCISQIEDSKRNYRHISFTKQGCQAHSILALGSSSLSLPVSTSYSMPTTVGPLPANSGSSCISFTSSLMLASRLRLCQSTHTKFDLRCPVSLTH